MPVPSNEMRFFKYLKRNFNCGDENFFCGTKTLICRKCFQKCRQNPDSLHIVSASRDKDVSVLLAEFNKFFVHRTNGSKVLFGY